MDRPCVYRCWALLAVVTCLRLSWADDMEVTIGQGALRGRRLVARSGRDYLGFLGIPYARPPVGELRFKLAEPAEGWSGVRDATQDAPMCPQIEVYQHERETKGEEDCLYVNVYSPQTKPDKPLAVMFWIHGGGWLSGSGRSDLYGADYLLDKDVVLVTFNYRLGPLGFLSTGDSICPGNNGLKDQTLALKWVRDNIAEFGGDPKRVTLFGQSAGGASTHYHMLSPLSKGLFHGGISHSGTAVCMWAYSSPEVHASRASKLGQLLDCPTASSRELVDCLRTKDALEIVATDPHFRDWGNDPIIPFRPVVEKGEGAFLTDEPLELLQDSRNIANVPWIAGLTSSDGAINTAMVFRNSEQVQDLNDNFDRIAPITLLYGDTSPDPDLITRRVREFYFGDHPISNETRHAVTDMYTDSFSLIGIDEAVRLQATHNSAPVFYYYFDYKPPTSYSSLFGAGSEDFGVCHSDDLQFLFPHDKIFPNSTLSEQDLKIVDIVTTLWTEFAQTGNPSPAGHQYVHWHPVKNSEVEYLHLDKEGNTHMLDHLLPERAHFWASLPLFQHSYTSVKDEL